MAKSSTTAFPTAGGSYVVKPDGKVDQVEATKPLPAVHVHDDHKPAPMPAGPQAAPQPAATPPAPKAKE